jgi:hypothetical protein
MVLDSLSIKVETLITIKVDNIGAIFVAENMSATSQAKHVDTRYQKINLVCLQRM